MQHACACTTQEAGSSADIPDAEYIPRKEEVALAIEATDLLVVLSLKRKTFLKGEFRVFWILAISLLALFLWSPKGSF